MEFNKVEAMPLSDKGMNEKLATIIEQLQNMNEGDIIEITDEDSKPIGIKGRLKSAMKRVPSAKFKVRISNNKVYVKKESDMIPKTNNTENTPEKKTKRR